MQQVTDSVNQYDESAGTFLQNRTSQSKATGNAAKEARRFLSIWGGARQLQAFFAWLPQELHDAPGMCWTRFQQNSWRSPADN